MLQNATAVPLPTLITPAMTASVNRAVQHTIAPGDSPVYSSSGTAISKKNAPGRMRVSRMSRMARNFHAHAYLKGHPSATTEEFARVHGALDTTGRSWESTRGKE
ncbi:hypothetical protein BC628DRAFT_1367624 [Trametes gibbosa]|nr:hypothetical protein BC628DRAFT_1367624 [Trametes gibbosa]